MTLVKQFLDRDALKRHGFVSGEVQSAVDGLLALRFTRLRLFFLMSGADPENDDLINRMEVTPLQFFLHQLFGLGVELDSHGHLQDHLYDLTPVNCAAAFSLALWRHNW